MTYDASPVGSFLVLTEDTASDAEPTVVAIVKNILKCLDEHTATNRLRFEPGNDLARSATRANLWKSTNPRDRAGKVNLRQTIATKLLERGVPGFVVFHYDGDRTWANKDTSENVRMFEREIVIPVRQLLEGSGRPHSEISAAMRKLVEVTPFYSIEAWLYQNAAAGAALCAAGKCSRCEFSTFAADPTILDEIEKPKDAVCFRSSHNLALATRGFPTSVVLAAGKSFARVVSGMGRNSALAEILKASHSYDTSSQSS